MYCGCCDMPDIVNPTSDQIKKAMIQETPVLYDGVEYACIIGFCCRPSRPDVYGKRRLYSVVEPKSRTANCVVVVNPNKITIHERDKETEHGGGR